MRPGGRKYRRYNRLSLSDLYSIDLDGDYLTVVFSNT